MDTMKEYSAPIAEFGRDSRRFLKRCTKPDRAEFMKIAKIVALGFVVMGGIGYAVKLLTIPLNHILVS